MFPNSFILVLLDFVWYSIINYLQSPFLSLSDFCMLLLRRLMLIERSREVGVSAGTSISSTFLYSVA